MPAGIVPESFLGLLAAFAGCFTAPSYRNFELLVVGWVHCLGRRTITAVALAAGGAGHRHISVFHRFFSRAVRVPDDIGRVVFGLAAAWMPAAQPLYLVIDYALVLLWYADHVHPDVAAGHASGGWPDRPWYRAKATPSFPDMLAELRRAGWRRHLSRPPSPPRRHQNPAFSWPDAVLATA